MSIINHLILSLSYIIVSIVSYALLPVVDKSFTPSLAVLAAGVIFLLGAFGHMALARTIREKWLQAELKFLDEKQQGAVDTIQSLQNEMNNLRSELDQNGGTKNPKLVSELKMIQTLLKQVADKSRRRPISSTTDKIEMAADPEKSDEEIYAIISDALDDNRVDLWLQPIVSLPQRKTRHYEAYSRVRNEDGSTIYPNEFMRVAEQSGLITTLDNIMLLNCVHLIRNLDKRLPGVRFFCNISSLSLSDAQFFPQFLEFMQGNSFLASRLVFEFSQADIAEHRGDVEHSLAQLGSLGFQFSMDNVTSLDIDFAGLADRYFRFVKVPVDLLVSREGDIHSADLKEAMKRQGIDLIAEKVEKEDTVLDLLDFNVDYGQGYLFGEPRRSKNLDPVEESDQRLAS